MLVLAGALLLLIVAETAREMADTEPGQSGVFDLAFAVAEAIVDTYLVAGLALVMGGLVYLLLSRQQDHLPRSDLQLGGGSCGSGCSSPAVPRVSMLGGTRSTFSLSSNSFYRLRPALAKRRQTCFRIPTLAEKAQAT